MKYDKAAFHPMVYLLQLSTFPMAAGAAWWLFSPETFWQRLCMVGVVVFIWFWMACGYATLEEAAQKSKAEKP